MEASSFAPKRKQSFNRKLNAHRVAKATEKEDNAHMHPIFWVRFFTSPQNTASLAFLSRSPEKDDGIFSADESRKKEAKKRAAVTARGKIGGGSSQK